MVYGVVMYDFAAERPDELEAKAGEAIIVIAQSNPEWFVAKPIGRLGGPGLIPVSFIEIRDMTTGKPVPDAHEAVQRAGVPKVEEWKKMAAEYKNSSITLGKFASSEGTQSVQQDLSRLTLTNGGQNYQNGHGRSGSVSCRTEALPDNRLMAVINRLSVITNEAAVSITRPTRTRLDLGRPPIIYSPPYQHRYPDTVSQMTNIGTSLKQRWRMADTGSFLVSTRIFTISKLRSSQNFQKTLEIQESQGHSRLCQAL
jgi:hypothetical protein